MAPEQRVPHAKIDERADIYALGCVFFYLLTGLTQTECVCRGVTFPSVAEAGISVPQEVQNTLETMTQPVAARRFTSMNDVIAALEKKTPSRNPKHRLFRVLFISLGILLCTVIGTLIFLSVSPLVSVSPPNPSQTGRTPVISEMPAAASQNSEPSSASSKTPENTETPDSAVPAEYAVSTSFSSEHAEISRPESSADSETVPSHPSPSPGLSQTSSAKNAEIELLVKQADSLVEKEKEKTETNPELIQQAARLYEKALRQGSSEAALCLWQLFWTQRYFPESPAALLDEVTKMAENGDTRAMLWLGYHYWYGRSCERSPETAVKWFQFAVNSGQKNSDVDECLYFLGRASALGEGLPQSSGKALEYYRLSDCPVAACELGIAFMNADGVPKDEEKAFSLFESACGRCVQGTYLYAYCLEHKIGCRQNLPEAVRAYRYAHESEEFAVSRGAPPFLTETGLKDFPSNLYEFTIRRNLNVL